MMIGRRRSGYAVYTEILYPEDWYSRSKFCDKDGETSEAARLLYLFGRVEES